MAKKKAAISAASSTNYSIVLGGCSFRITQTSERTLMFIPAIFITAQYSTFTVICELFGGPRFLCNRKPCALKNIFVPCIELPRFLFLACQNL